MDFTVSKIKRHIGNFSDFYTIKAIYKGIRLNAVYDNHKRMLTVHEWYKLTKEQLLDVQQKIREYINNNTEK